VSDPYVRPVNVSELFNYEDDTGDHDVHCGDEPGDCAIVAWAPNSNRSVGVPIDVTPGPLAVRPLDQETGFPVHAVVTVPAGSRPELAECLTPVAATLAESRCTTPQPVTVDAEGRASVQFTVVDQFSTPGGLVDCPTEGCAVSLFDGAGTMLRAVPVILFPSDGPPVMTAERTTDLTDGLTIRADISGTRNEGFTLAQCDASVTTAAQVASGPCSAPLFSQVGSRHIVGSQPDITVQTTLDAVDGSTVHCDRSPGACVLALASDLGNFTSLPLSFRVDDTLSLSPASGLLQGDTITVEAANLDPGAGYHVLRCIGLSTQPDQFFNDRTCETPIADTPILTASPDGRITTTLPARQRFTTLEPRPAYCRDQCQVALVREGFGFFGYTVAGYAMATGSITATPATGLTDDQPVTVTGTDLMPTYDGPTFLFLHAGIWALAECGRGVLDDQTVVGVLRNCSIPPGSGVVQVDGSTFTRTVQAQESFDPPLGDHVDCGDPCVLLLGRFEQDGSLSIHTTPIAFGH
jgi:hypothetical protein